MVLQDIVNTIRELKNVMIRNSSNRYTTYLVYTVVNITRSYPPFYDENIVFICNAMHVADNTISFAVHEIITGGNKDYYHGITVSNDNLINCIIVQPE